MLKGSREAVLRKVQPISVHGQISLDVHFVYPDDDTEQVRVARIGPEAMDKGLEPGDRVVLDFVLGVVTQREARAPGDGRIIDVSSPPCRTAGGAMRHLPLFVLPLLTGLSLVPAPASAQKGPVSLDGIARTEDDLGTWDAVLVGRTPFGRVVSERGVEINTRGCDGTCIVTKLKGALAPRNGGSRAWWQDYDSPGRQLRRSHRTCRRRVCPQRNVAGRGPYLDATRSPTQPSGDEPAASRTSVVPSEGHRIVTVYVKQPDGSERMAARITYTRRK